VVVCESFNYQRRDKVVLTSVEYIGVAKLWCATTKSKYEPQSPSQGKGFWDDKKLKAVGLYTNSPHSRDATRHMLYYFTFTLTSPRFLDLLQDRDSTSNP